MNKLHETVADDRLSGATEISRFTGDPSWKVYQHAAQGRRGIYKVGRRLYGSKKILSQDHQDRASAGTAE